MTTPITKEQAPDLRSIPSDLPASEYKLGDEFKPFHPAASHVWPEYRDGWNSCWLAAQAAAVPQVQALEDARDAARFVAIYSSAFTEEVSDAFCAELEKFGNRPTLDQYRAAIDAALHSKEPKGTGEDRP